MPCSHCSRQAGQSEDREQAGKKIRTNFRSKLKNSARSLCFFHSALQSLPRSTRNCQKGSETHTLAQKITQPFPNCGFMFGCSYYGPWFSLFPISASTIHYSSTVSTSTIHQVAELACRWVSLQPHPWIPLLLWYLKNIPSSGLQGFLLSILSTLLSCCLVCVTSQLLVISGKPWLCFTGVCAVQYSRPSSPMSTCKGRCFTGNTPHSKPWSQVGRSEGRSPSCDFALSPVLSARGKYLRRPLRRWSSVKLWLGWSDDPSSGRATLLHVTQAALCLAGGTEGSVARCVCHPRAASAACRASALPPFGLPAPNPEACVTLSYSYKALSC